MGEDPEHVADSQIMVRSVNNSHIVALPYITLAENPKIGPGSAGFGKATRKQLIVHPHRESPAGYPRFRYLEQGASNLPSLSDDGIRDVNAVRREVLAELSMLQ